MDVSTRARATRRHAPHFDGGAGVRLFLRSWTVPVSRSHISTWLSTLTPFFCCSNRRRSSPTPLDKRLRLRIVGSRNSRRVTSNDYHRLAANHDRVSMIQQLLMRLLTKIRDGSAKADSTFFSLLSKCGGKTAIIKITPLYWGFWNFIVQFLQFVKSLQISVEWESSRTLA